MPAPNFTPDQIENYEEVEKLVIQYQQGSKEAGESLLDAFEPFLRKYLSILKDGRVNLKDKDTRNFVRLFMRDEEAKRKIVKNKTSLETRQKAYRAATTISHICINIPEEDLYQELITAFLQLAFRYKKKGTKTNFCGYVYNTYRFEIYRSMRHYLSDPISYRADLNVCYCDEEYIEKDEQMQDSERLNHDTLMMIIEEDLGNSWVRGLICAEEFETLTCLERLILKMSYGQSMTDIDIATKTGMHRNSIRKQRETAVEKVRLRYGESYE